MVICRGPFSHIKRHHERVQPCSSYFSFYQVALNSCFAGVSSRVVMPSLCAAALAQMNHQAPPLPLACGGVFAVGMVLRACNQIQAGIRRKQVVSLHTRSVVVDSGFRESRQNHANHIVATHHQILITPEFETSAYDMQSKLLGSPHQRLAK